MKSSLATGRPEELQRCGACEAVLTCSKEQVKPQELRAGEGHGTGPMSEGSPRALHTAGSLHHLTGHEPALQPALTLLLLHPTHLSEESSHLSTKEQRKENHNYVE